MRAPALVRGALAALALGLTATPLKAQTEAFEIGLSTDSLAVGTNFAGAQLVVFGVLENADQRTLRQGRYDIVVVLEGPPHPVVVRERERFLGLWINRGAERFDAIPASYSLSATRPLRDIATRERMQQLSLGAGNLPFSREDSEADRAEYGGALLRLRREAGLYADSIGSIEFVSGTLFRASVVLPPDIPVGRHTVRAFLFREGTFIHGRTETLWVRKTGFESRISVYAANNGLAYGIVAVLLAFAIGWLGRILFKRD